MNDPTNKIEPINLSKSDLRKSFLTKRRLLSDQEFLRRNENITRHLTQYFRFKPGENIHVFLPIEKNKEVNTWPMIDLLAKQGGQVIISRSKTTENVMEHFLYNQDTELKNNSWGIPEPVSGQRIEVDAIDTVLIPLLVYDRSGGRIGYGKGYYDRFLSTCRPQVRKIGLSLAPPLDKILCLESTDIPLDYCINPHGVLSFEATRYE